MASHLSQSAWNAALNAALALANGGTVIVYDGTQPATPNTAITSQNPLVTMTLNATAFGNASAGVATANAVTAGVAGASGTATWYRMYTSGSAAVRDGVVGTAGADQMNFPSTTFVSGTTYGITSWSISMPAGQ